MKLFSFTFFILLSLFFAIVNSANSVERADNEDAYRSVLESHLANALMLLKARQRLLLLKNDDSDVLGVIDDIIDPAIHMNIVAISPPENYRIQYQIPEVLEKREAVMDLLIESFCIYRSESARYFDADILRAIDSCAK